MELLNDGLFIDVLRNTVQPHSIYQVFAQLHQRKPLGYALNEPAVLFALLQQLHILSDLGGHLTEVRMAQFVLLYLGVILLHEHMVILPIQQLSIDSLAKYTRHFVKCNRLTSPELLKYQALELLVGYRPIERDSQRHIGPFRLVHKLQALR